MNRKIEKMTDMVKLFCAVEGVPARVKSGVLYVDGRPFRKVAQLDGGWSTAWNMIKELARHMGENSFYL